MNGLTCLYLFQLDRRPDFCGAEYSVNFCTCQTVPSVEHFQPDFCGILETFQKFAHLLFCVSPSPQCLSFANFALLNAPLQRRFRRFSFPYILTIQRRWVTYRRSGAGQRQKRGKVPCARRQFHRRTQDSQSFIYLNKQRLSSC